MIQENEHDMSINAMSPLQTDNLPYSAICRPFYFKQQSNPFACQSLSLSVIMLFGGFL